MDDSRTACTTVEAKALLRDCPSDITVKLKEQNLSGSINPHLHTEYEIYYSINGAKGFFVDEGYYGCEPHDMFIVGRMHIHKVTVADPEKYARCVISIDTTIIEKIRTLLSDTTALDFLDKIGDSLPAKVHLSHEAHEIFMLHVKEYLRLEQSEEHLLMTAKLFEILAFIKHVFVASNDEVCEISPETWAEKAIYYIEKNFRECQSTDVAKALCVNENYVSRVFKNETGSSLNNYIIRRKIAEAKKLLYHGSSVKEACVKSGFGDCSNFIRTFKKFTGMPPGAMKRKSSLAN